MLLTKKQITENYDYVKQRHMYVYSFTITLHNSPSSKQAELDGAN